MFLGSAEAYKGKGELANEAWQYLNPAVAASSTLFAQINRSTPSFTRFLVKTSHLVTTVSQRSADLSGLVSHLSTTTGALARSASRWARRLRDLPGFMRLANTTFVNLRSALDDLTPLVNASKPVAPKLQKLLVQLRPLAEDSVPTVKDLSAIVSKPGANNDLTDLVRLGVPLANATVNNVTANGKVRAGAFPQTVTALNDSTPELAVARPYAVDLTGWFEGYTHPGTNDANGGSSRVAPVVGRRLDRERHAQRAAGLHHSGPARTPGLRRRRSDGPADHRPGGPLPGLDGARSGLVPGERLPV